jgi:tetratricopeptide (TPR) repeat protein
VLEAARALAPSDVAVVSALAEAKAAADKDETEKKKLADYNARVAAAKTALEGGKFEDAAREAAAALVLVPDSEEARAVQKAANAKLAAAGKEEKRNRDVEAKLARAQASLDAKRYGEAVATLEAALKEVPEDREVTRLLRSARQALDKARQANARLLAQARDSASRGRYDQAVASATEATRNWPEDEAAVKLLRNAERLMTMGKANQEAYLTYMLDGELAMSRGRYTDAVAAYQAALQLVPGDLEVQRLLRSARIGADAMIRYERQLATATQALRARRYAEALAAYRAAGKLLPDDPAWRKGISDTQYTQAMQAGQLALSQRKRNEAIAAFEAALAARVADPLAQRGLEAARRLR